MGANSGFRTDMLRDIGGWREDYVAGGEDVELCWRAQLQGYEAGFATGATIAYRYRVGLKALARQYVHYGLADPRLYRDFRRRGAPRSRVSDAMKAYMRLLGHLPDLFRSPVARGNWVRVASYRWGRFRGSLQYRVLFL
jgi:GT2 family glycosyltransferase